LDHGQPPRSPYRPQPTGAQLCRGQARPGLAGRYLSYIATDEGWLYLAAIKDLATREIVGWSMADHLRTELCTDALVMAFQYHPPSPGLIHHSDRGVQYAAEPYRAVLARHGIVQSMSRRGNCLDNAPMESVFAFLKVEHVHHCRFRAREEAKAAVFDYIEVFYNRQRLHSALGYRTPAEALARAASARICSRNRLQLFVFASIFTRSRLNANG